MELRVIGAGLGRTGTMSLKLALEQLLGARCYHMIEVFAHPEHVPAWHAAARGTMPDWRALLADYAATVDWPAASFWPELSAAFPEALVLLSARDPQAWWQSASETIFPVSVRETGPWRNMIDAVFSTRFTLALNDRAAAIAAYERHYAAVRAAVPSHRLIEWQPGDGWLPLCTALGVPVPEEPFPRVNTRAEWQAGHGGAGGE
ncbi:MAG: sulfotransferase family protein [Deltaproteobacteria bacterium]|nr:sulfotransferase family protein [Deltaproteobacteria bacterium]